MFYWLYLVFSLSLFSLLIAFIWRYCESDFQNTGNPEVFRIFTCNDRAYDDFQESGASENGHERETDFSKHRAIKQQPVDSKESVLSENWVDVEGDLSQYGVKIQSQVVCQVSDISENGMRVFDIGIDGGKVLIIKQKGTIYAIGPSCTHFGAPLEKGVLGIGRVRCPWHGACFNIKTGDIEDFPGLDSVPSYQVEIDPDGGVRVHARKSDLANNKRTKRMIKRDAHNDETFVIIGGGPAGQVCAETLRQERFTGRLILISADQFPPYDRTRLSKYFIPIDELKLRSEEFYEKHDIELLLSTKVVGIYSGQKLLTLDNGETLNYSSLFIATGTIPRKLSVPGCELENIFTLRSFSDAKLINNVLTPASKVVILGSSFLGMELATYCISICNKGSVSVISRSATPFFKSLGGIVGGRIARMFVEKGVKLFVNVTIVNLKGHKTSVKTAVLSNGKSIPADVVIVAVGNTFDSDFLNDSGIALNENGSIPVDQFLETNCPKIFAGGDIVEAPVFDADGKLLVTTGHWGLAHSHGKIAALNMMSIVTPLKTVPFYWTTLFGTSFRYVGYPIFYDDMVIGGDIEHLKFACYYCKNDQVVAVTTVGVDPLAAQYAEFIYSGNTLYKKEVTENPLSWPKNIV